MSQTLLSDDERKKVLDGLAELTRLSREAIPLLRLLTHAKYEKAISRVLPSKDRRLVYAHSDGKRSSRELAGMAGVSHTTVNGWWNEWAQKGMGDRVPAVQGGGKGFKAKYTLLELAVAVLEHQVELD